MIFRNHIRSNMTVTKTLKGVYYQKDIFHCKYFNCNNKLLIIHIYSKQNI